MLVVVEGDYGRFGMNERIPTVGKKLAGLWRWIDFKIFVIPDAVSSLQLLIGRRLFMEGPCRYPSFVVPDTQPTFKLYSYNSYHFHDVHILVLNPNLQTQPQSLLERSVAAASPCANNLCLVIFMDTLVAASTRANVFETRNNVLRR